MKKEQEIEKYSLLEGFPLHKELKHNPTN